LEVARCRRSSLLCQARTRFGRRALCVAQSVVRRRMRLTGRKLHASTHAGCICILVARARGRVLLVLRGARPKKCVCAHWWRADKCVCCCCAVLARAAWVVRVGMLVSACSCRRAWLGMRTSACAHRHARVSMRRAALAISDRPHRRVSASCLHARLHERWHAGRDCCRNSCCSETAMLHAEPPSRAC